MQVTVGEAFAAGARGTQYRSIKAASVSVVSWVADLQGTHSGVIVSKTADKRRERAVKMMQPRISRV